MKHTEQQIHFSPRLRICVKIIREYKCLTHFEFSKEVHEPQFANLYFRSGPMMAWVFTFTFYIRFPIQTPLHYLRMMANHNVQYVGIYTDQHDIQ